MVRYTKLMMAGAGVLACLGLAGPAQAALGDLVAQASSQAAVSASIQPIIQTATQMAAQPSAAQIAAAKAEQARIDKVWAARTENTMPLAAPIVVPPVAGTETVPGRAPASAAGPMATLPVLRNAIFNMGGTTSNISEPAVAVQGKFIFATYNWGASRSIDGGVTWTNVNPNVGWPIGHSFCCDQDVVSAPAHNLIIWYRQGIKNLAGENYALLSVSRNGGATFATYQISSAIFAGAGQWFDYPRLALSNNYVYWTTNVFNAAGVFQKMMLFKVPLSKLRGFKTIVPKTWFSPTGWAWSPVEGATDTMYLGDTTNSTGSFKVCKQRERSTVLTCVNRVIPAWTFTNRTGVCTGPNGFNPCLRADQRITAGYVARNGRSTGEIAFFWNVMQGGTFLKPYVNGVKFHESNMGLFTGLAGRPYIFNSVAAWQYASFAPNAQGEVGGVVNYFQAAVNPQTYALVDDRFNGMPPGWEVHLLSTSAGGPSGSSWGDYNRARAMQPAGCGWGLASYTKSATNVSEERYYVVARGMYSNCVKRWWTR